MMITTYIQSLPMKLTFAQWLKLRRDMMELTQAAIASELGIRPQTVSHWEKGTTIPNLNPEQTLRLCRLLKVTLEELVRGFRGEVGIDD
jgi:DNA-binding XRE family transcriptional regulator